MDLDLALKLDLIGCHGLDLYALSVFFNKVLF
jgi:hypothetical protein